jgi:hypothetical protein
VNLSKKGVGCFLSECFVNSLHVLAKGFHKDELWREIMHGAPKWLERMAPHNSDLFLWIDHSARLCCNDQFRTIQTRIASFNQ